MQQYKADFHIHTVLSPCGSLEMSPKNIVRKAMEAGLEIIAITDHNSTRQAKIIKELAAKEGLFVLCGAEINSAEEVHCLTLFENNDQLLQFQNFLDNHLIRYPNNPKKFGHQVVVDENELIIYEEEYLLINALDVGMVEIEKEVHRLNGLFIPAHVDRPFNGIFSQMGFLPDNLKCDAFGLSTNANLKEWQTNGKIPKGASLLRNSDAHMPEQIGKAYNILEMEEISFDEIRKAILGIDGRSSLPTLNIKL